MSFGFLLNAQFNIEELDSNYKVEEFANKMINDSFYNGKLKLNHSQKFREKKYNSYYKADLNNDGKQDLLGNFKDKGDNMKPILFLSDDDTYNVNNLKKLIFDNFFLCNIKDSDNGYDIEIVRELINEDLDAEGFDDLYFKTIEEKTLYITDDNKIYEYPKPTKTLHIKSVQVDINYFLGASYSLVLTKNKQSIFIARNKNFTEDYLGTENFISLNEGYFITKIKDKDWEKLEAEINKIHYPSQFLEYYETAGHLPHVEIIIEQENGERIFINDLGMSRNYSLVNLYNYFNSLRFSLNWKPIVKNY